MYTFKCFIYLLFEKMIIMNIGHYLQLKKYLQDSGAVFSFGPSLRPPVAFYFLQVSLEQDEWETVNRARKRALDVPQRITTFGHWQWVFLSSVVRRAALLLKSP